MNTDRLSNAIDSLTVYKNIRENGIIKLIQSIINEEDNLKYISLLISRLTEIGQDNGIEGDLFKNYIEHLVLREQNPFTLACENNLEVKNSSLYSLARIDLKTLKTIAEFDLKDLPDADFLLPAIEEMKIFKPAVLKSDLNFNHDFDIDKIVAFHNKNGCGDISVYKAFRYNEDKKSLKGITDPDPITFEDLVGYRSQITQLKANTLSFIKGYSANNVLLVGARGTGKSSCVKALVNEYFDKGLRLVEITKEQIANLPDILGLLRKRGRKFIIFIDDLSFDENEIEYKYMKSVLEGGSEGKPDNVLFYATSNRRHIIQESWKDRGETVTDSLEIHTADTMNEKLSLSDRFGITIYYPKPGPEEYMDIVTSIAQKSGLKISKEKLRAEAMKWELRQKGRSGRTARQFVNDMLCREEENEEK